MQIVHALDLDQFYQPDHSAQAWPSVLLYLTHQSGALCSFGCSEQPMPTEPFQDASGNACISEDYPAILRLLRQPVHQRRLSIAHNNCRVLSCKTPPTLSPVHPDDASTPGMLRNAANVTIKTPVLDPEVLTSLPDAHKVAPFNEHGAERRVKAERLRHAFQHENVIPGVAGSDTAFAWDAEQRAHTLQRLQLPGPAADAVHIAPAPGPAHNHPDLNAI